MQIQKNIMGLRLFRYTALAARGMGEAIFSGYLLALTSKRKIRTIKGIP
jgi:hypothetical protein